MNREKLKKELNLIEEVIYDFFNHNYQATAGAVPVFDAHLSKRGAKIGYYCGVTPRYIRQYLFNNKYSLSMIHYVLLKLFYRGEKDGKKIKTFHCNDIHKVIFSNYKMYGSYEIEHVKERDSYRIIRGNYNAINSYLNSNKIENSNS